MLRRLRGESVITSVTLSLHRRGQPTKRVEMMSFNKDSLEPLLKGVDGWSMSFNREEPEIDDASLAWSVPV
jgi:hypothetical protein